LFGPWGDDRARSVVAAVSGVCCWGPCGPLPPWGGQPFFRWRSVWSAWLAWLVFPQPQIFKPATPPAWPVFATGGPWLDLAHLCWSTAGQAWALAFFPALQVGGFQRLIPWKFRQYFSRITQAAPCESPKVCFHSLLGLEKTGLCKETNGPTAELTHPPTKARPERGLEKTMTKPQTPKQKRAQGTTGLLGGAGRAGPWGGPIFFPFLLVSVFAGFGVFCRLSF